MPACQEQPGVRVHTHASSDSTQRRLRYHSKERSNRSVRLSRDLLATYQMWASTLQRLALELLHPVTHSLVAQKSVAWSETMACKLQAVCSVCRLLVGSRVWEHCE